MYFPCLQRFWRWSRLPGPRTGGSDFMPFLLPRKHVSASVLNFSFVFQNLKRLCGNLQKGGWKLKVSGPTKPRFFKFPAPRDNFWAGRLANDVWQTMKEPVDSIPLRKRRISETLTGQYSFVDAGLKKSKNKHSWKVGPKTSQDMPFMRFLRQASDIFLSTVSSAPVACSADSSLAILFFDVSDSCVQLANPCRARPLLSAQRITKDLGI